MTGKNATPVTVIGLGSMGTALAEAFIKAGHSTTVWNRTPAKAAPLVAMGARQAEAVEDAVAASPLIITCLTTFDDTRLALRPAAASLHGRALVTLNSGSPDGARQTATWAIGHGARFLAGAVKNVPSAVGAPDTLLYYSGDKTVFDEFEATLKVLGGDTVHLGDDSDLAALYEMAVGAMLLPALVGFFQGAAAVQARGLEVSTMVRFAGKWLDMIKSLLPIYANEIDSGDYTDAASSVNLFLAGAAHDADLTKETNVDTAWLAPLNDLVVRAAQAGHGDHSISALTEVLRKPA
ncbi:NAD(P)-dependent oxidoreductase [Streptosporangium roseum]|uniref:NAD_Gly3P_dh, NAD-dependent glycerol-3-phosphate dehydrogenase n=1 Tax=Streptosporangium roseum (strain ATCC 12428 / DSM 43021 / JCM 3005 / KCTC 9067 / NCIMB 10171 / NRRL 2505 / NI 9100) TaxID=479432 RepID=D2B8Q2_STRRD|nr:NAD(P)-binding domain-containing protein [Streptosporangium roseum]ACZ87862.1 NAD_Gly3P_dh, NAD-dependent glycerol-3-phosphate dehydrogenase [Streptosporangium roseum DSM 43021]